MLPPTRPLVLVVDDEPSVRESLGAVLTHLGCRVVACGDGLQALEYLSLGHGLAAAFVDCSMPGLGGMEVAPRFGELGIPAVLMSGYPLDTVPPAAGIRYVLRKPFGIRSIQELLARLGLLPDGIAPTPR